MFLILNIITDYYKCSFVIERFFAGLIIADVGSQIKVFNYHAKLLFKMHGSIENIVWHLTTIMQCIQVLWRYAPHQPDNCQQALDQV